MFRKISSTFIIIIISMVANFAATIYLGRKLSIFEFGEYSLLKSIIAISPTIAALGLGTSIIKVFPNIKININIHYLTLFLTLITSTLICIPIKFIYNYQIQSIIIILFIIWFGALSLYSAENFRLKNSYLIAQFVQSGWKTLFFLIIMIFAIFKIFISKNLIIYSFLVSIFIPVISFVFLVTTEKNTSTISREEVKKFIAFGLLFWLINSMGLISGAIDKFVIPLVFSKEILGIYSALSFFFVTSLTMVGSAIGYVIFPTISKGEKVNWNKFIFFICMIIVFALVVFLSSGNQIIDKLYDGKYNTYSSWKFTFCFTILGILQIGHTVSHFIIIAKSTKKYLFLYFIVTILSVLLFLVIIFVLKYYFIFSLFILTVVIIVTRVIKLIVMGILLLHISKKKVIGQN